ncbi:MAG: hypothetical protein P8Y93_05510 [Acidobacteriota bacterium]
MKWRPDSLAAVLNGTSWDYSPGQDRTFLLRPVGRIFEDVPWEVHTWYLGPEPNPAPVKIVNAPRDSQND